MAEGNTSPRNIVSKKHWRYYPVVIVGSGPSLSDAQCEEIIRARDEDRCRVIVTNNNFQRVPNADIIFAADKGWWKVYGSNVGRIAPKIERWSCDACNREYGCQFVPAIGGSGIPGVGDGRIYRGSSSGYMACGLAVSWGAVHIVLVGMDCMPGPDGKNHWFGEHDKKKLPNPQPLGTWAMEWDRLAKPAEERGIRIVNCSLRTAIKLLPTSTLEKELEP